MEICPVPARLPVVPLQIAEGPRSLPIQIAITSPFRTSLLCRNWRQQTDTMISESPNRMFILGMGFVGQFFAADLKNQGWIVSGTCTCDSKKKKLEEMGYNFFQHGELLKSRLEDGNLRWLCYLSSTGVYGDCGGRWVDEDSFPISFSNELAKARLMAEERWLNLGHDLGLSVKIFRLGGIYGPGRSAVDTIIKQGSLSELQKKRLYRQYTSRVHVADICQVLNATIHEPSSGKIFNIVDDDPAPRIEVFKYARHLVEKKWPGQLKWPTPFDMAESSIPPKGSSMGEKRVSNARMKMELGVTLLYPSYQSGLQSIIEDMDD